MKLKLDENISYRAATPLIDLGHDVATVAAEGLGGHNDTEIAEASGREGRILVTQDVAFGDVRRYPPGQHPGIIVIHMRSQSVFVVQAALRALAEQHKLEEMVGCLIIVEPSRIRIRRPRV